MVKNSASLNIKLIIFGFLNYTSSTWMAWIMGNPFIVVRLSRIFLIGGLFLVFLVALQILGRFFLIAWNRKDRTKNTSRFQIFMSIGFFGYAGGLVYASALILHKDTSFYPLLPDLVSLLLSISSAIFLAYMTFQIPKINRVGLVMVFALLAQEVLVQLGFFGRVPILILFLFGFGTSSTLVLLLYLFRFENKETRKTLLILGFGFGTSKWCIIVFHHFWLRGLATIPTMAIFTYVFLIGLLIIFGGLNRLNKLSALDWKAEILGLFVFSRKGQLEDLYAKAFIPAEFEFARKEFLNYGLIGINDVLKATAENATETTQIKWKNLNFLFNYQKDYVVCLIVQYVDKLHREILQRISKAFSQEFEQELQASTLNEKSFEIKSNKFTERVEQILKI